MPGREAGGAITSAGEGFSSIAGVIYVFNLIVGTGALTMPQAFQKAGWLTSLCIVTLLSITSYITATFVIEVMASANAVMRWNGLKKLSQRGIASEETLEKIRSATDDERAPLINSLQQYSSETSNDGSSNLYAITERVELGKMASMFFSKVGQYVFYIIIAVYLYGDLAIYAAAVPKSLRDTTCTYKLDESHCNGSSLEDLPCWPGSDITRMNAYRIYVAIFSVMCGPFVFFNVQKTKYLQYFTTVLRWLAFGLMITLTSIQLARGRGEGHPPVAEVSGIPNLFGVCVYSFMCHHSLPSLVTPIKNKSKLSFLFAADYALILCFYVLLSFTGIFAFSQLDQLYTSNFIAARCSDSHHHAITSFIPIQYFLSLFPVFTLSTNFPIISITLRSNLQTLFYREGMSPVINKIVIPLLAIIPPIAVAFGTHDLEMLVGITGSYAGAAIQYMIPTALVYFSRRKLRFLLGSDNANPHCSPFKHKFWQIAISAWCLAAIAFVTANHIITNK